MIDIMKRARGDGAALPSNAGPREEAWHIGGSPTPWNAQGRASGRRAAQFHHLPCRTRAMWVAFYLDAAWQLGSGEAVEG